MKTAAPWVILLALAASLAAAPSDEINFTTTSVNVTEPGTPVKIRILRFSTDDERAPLLAALTPAPARGLPAEAGRNPNPAAAGGGARGAAGRGRGRGRGAAVAPLTPIAAFTALLGRAPTIGYIWTSDITGYSIKYAWHAPLPDGIDRIVLVSDRRLGAYTNAWKPLAAEASAKAAETDYAFTLIELRVGPNGSLEGKTSLTNRIAVDNDAKTITLENYSTIPTTLR